MVEITAAVLSGEAYYERLDQLNVAPLWRLPEANAARTPVPAVPYLWRWREVLPRLQQAAEVVDLESGAERRVLTMLNPGMRPYAGATHTITASLQMILPGEIAPAHRHTFAALRFIIQGEGGFTVVEGEKVPMHPGDLILTPNWTWHDHGHNGQAEPVIWLDGLDVPFVRALGAGFYQDYPGRQPQIIRKAGVDSYQRYGGGTVVAAKQRARTLYSPLNLYRWEQAYAALRELQQVDLDAHDGAILEYVHPLTGGHVLPTMACYLQALPAGAPLQAHRHTASTVSYVVRGAGSSVLDSQRVDWEQGDILAIPPWVWHEHAAAAGEEAILFTMSDVAMLEPFGLDREEAYKSDEGHQAVGASTS